MVGASISTTESAHAAICATFRVLGVNIGIVPTAFVRRYQQQIGIKFLPLQSCVLF